MSVEQIPINMPPAALWIGPHDLLVEHATAYLQDIFCPHKGCRTCTTCLNIRKQQFHATIWLAPESHYTLDDIEVIFQTITFALEVGQQLFFIIQKADFLTPLCSNKLLKSIEEPPAGYHFLFLAQRQSALLPTIQSRCVLRSFYEQSESYDHAQLFSCFTKQTNPTEFLKILDQSKISERESVELLDQLLMHWIRANTKAIVEQNSDRYRTSARATQLFKNALLTLPMPGSSKLFWKNLFMQSQ